MRKILDVTDSRIRPLQGLCLAISGGLTGLAASIGMNSGGSLIPAIVAGVVGLGLLVVAASIKQRWEILYRGHKIRFENSPVMAERLYLDDGLVARGGLGSKMEMRAPIRVGEGVGEEVMALSDAGMLKVRLRIYIESEDPEAAVPAATILATASPVVHSGTIGKLVLAKQVMEFVAALIAVVGAVTGGLLWVFR